jgi:hypothetical protein
MDHQIKMRLWILGYCLFLWSTNWSLMHKYARTVGLKSSGIDLHGLGLLITIAITIILARKAWLLMRKMLDRGMIIPLKSRIWGQKRNIILLLPLALNYSVVSNEIGQDGVMITTTFEYGSELVPYTILTAWLAIMLFQTLCNLNACAIEDRSDKYLP